MSSCGLESGRNTGEEFIPRVKRLAARLGIEHECFNPNHGPRKRHEEEEEEEDEDEEEQFEAKTDEDDLGEEQQQE